MKTLVVIIFFSIVGSLVSDNTKTEGETSISSRTIEIKIPAKKKAKMKRKKTMIAFESNYIVDKIYA